MVAIPSTLLLAFVIPFISGIISIPAVRDLAIRLGWYDMPDDNRKFHAKPIPNIGGIAIAASVFAGIAFLITIAGGWSTMWTTSNMLVMGGLLLILITGFLDDLYEIGFKEKFLIQLIVAYMLMHAGYKIDLSVIPFITLDPYTEALYSIPLTLLWIVGLFNAINLIDGIDGLAGGVSLIAFATFAVIFGIQGNFEMTALCVVLIGALSAFLIFNFNPASIFMGDSGSLFLGFMLTLCSLSVGADAGGNSIVTLIVPMIVLALPLFDMILTICRRISKGLSPFNPDRNHTHHRLIQLYSVKQSAVILYGIAASLGVVAITMMYMDPVLVAISICSLLMLAITLDRILTISLDVQEVFDISTLFENSHRQESPSIEALPTLTNIEPLQETVYEEAFA